MDSPSLTYVTLRYLDVAGMAEVADVVNLSENDEICSLTAQNIITRLIKIHR